MAGVAAMALAGWAAPAAAGAQPHPTVRSEVPITATDIYNKPSNNSPQLAVDPTDARFVVVANRLDAPFNCSLQASGDGGRSWVSARPVPQLPEGADTCYAPEVAFGRHGLLYYLFVGLREPGSSPMGVYLTTSRDRAHSFSPPRQVLGPRHYGVRMAFDPTYGAQGRIHLVWLEANSDPPLGGLPSPPNPIMAAHSDDGGATFSPPVHVSDSAHPLAVAPAATIGANHSLHVLYYDLGDDQRDYRGLEGTRWEGNWSLVAATSPDAGGHFAPGVTVDDGVVPPERVMLIFTMPPAALVADGHGGLYAAWHDARNDDWDVFLRHSPDGGRTWSPATQVNDNRGRDETHQYLPRLSVAPNGRLDVIFYDRRNNVENRGNDVYYTFSNDRGATFAPNRKLTALDSDSMVGPKYAVPSAMGMVDFGSRLGLVSTNARVLAAWTDTRFTARGNPAQDIFGTEIDFGAGSSGVPGWLAGAGVAVGWTAAGLAAWGLIQRRNRREQA